MKSRSHISRVGIEGALMVLSPFPLVFLIVDEGGAATWWRLPISLVSAIALTLSAFTLLRKPAIGKIAGIVAVVGGYGAALPRLVHNPFAALAATVIFIGAVFFLVDFHTEFRKAGKIEHVARCRQRAWWGSVMVPVLVVINALLGSSVSFFFPFVVSFSSVISLMLYLHWSLESGSKRRVLFAVAGLILLAASWFAFGVEKVTWSALSVAVGLLLAFPRRKGPFEKIEHGWEVFVIHPARLLLTSFLALCVLGTLMLVLPVSTCEGVIEPIDAVFTAVSAVCVTGLIVLDTPNDFTLFGQLCVLILIQLGGLGIMSLATVALHAMGRRLSLRQERLLSSITDTGRRDLVHALKMILKFTFVAESVGAVLLVFLFHDAGDSFRHALWRGVFTAVSAFCNAGFALQSDSLIPYRENVFIIHTVSTLIIFGGMAPATSLLLPRWISGKPIPTPAWIALGTTGILLVSGTLFILAFEWNGVLSGLAPFEKIQNAWFQSATLRTAGFNSLDIAGIAGPTFFVMIAFMFIGGSPGGTAGGVKTTTIGILAMTFWANITNHSDVVTHNRRIHPFTVYRAITIVVAGMAVWFVAVLMLQVTQQVSTRDLVFEATSALGTVGLSTGATSLLDEIGKIIIIITMFVGRIGPMTLFMLLSDSNAAKASRCIEEKISLT